MRVDERQGQTEQHEEDRRKWKGEERDGHQGLEGGTVRMHVEVCVCWNQWMSNMEKMTVW